MKKRYVLFLVICVTVVAGIGVWAMQSPTIIDEKTISELKPGIQEASYQYLSNDDRIDQAEAIFVGTVLAISDTQWNQNSGERWEADDQPDHPAALLYHTIDIEVTQPMIDMINIGRKVTITVLGNGPRDTAHSDDPVKEGDVGIFFVERRAIAWREGGTRKVIYFLGAPSQCYFLKASDGLFYPPKNENEKGGSLEEIIKEIAGRRSVLVQP